MDDRDGLSLLELVATKCLLGECKVMPVLQAGERGRSPHLCQEHQGPPVNQAVVLRQASAQRASGVAAQHQQGHQKEEARAIGVCQMLLAWLGPGTRGTLLSWLPDGLLLCVSYMGSIQVSSF